MFNATLIRQFKKFLVVGGASTLLNYGVFLLLYQYVGVQYLASSAIGYIAGLLTGYFFNRSWTFTSSRQYSTRELFSYCGVYITSLALSIIFLRFLVQVLGLPPALANIAAIGLSTITNFLGCKVFVFSRSTV